MSIDFKGRVAIVTGAGGGLGCQHALALAARATALGAHKRPRRRLPMKFALREVRRLPTALR